MHIGVPAETLAGETRVAVTPETVKKLKSHGHTVRVQSGAGLAASVTDEAYVAAGAEITDAAGALGSELVLKVRTPVDAEAAMMTPGATLVGMLKGTSYYNPVQNPERARLRRNVVLAQMVKYGGLDPAKVEALAKRPLKVNFERQIDMQGAAPHVAQHLRKWLLAWADIKGYNIMSDGLRVRTTIDAQIQKLANQAVTRQLIQLQKLADGQRKAGKEHPLLQAGFLALDPRSGAVRAWVGSRDFADRKSVV